MAVVRRTAVGLALVVAMGSLGACARQHGDQDKALAAIRLTEAKARRFTYVESTEGNRLEVTGAVHDDFRYAAHLKVNGGDMLDEVYDDDSLALRVLDGDRLNTALGVTGAGTVVGGAKADEALVRHQWVVDAKAAPPLQVANRTGPIGGIDPVDEGFRYLQFAEKAIQEGYTVNRYSADSTDYKPSEDPFPLPKGKSVIRYDIVRPWVPRPTAQAGPGSRDTPSARNFRKMSIYVRNGLVFEIREDTRFAERYKDTIDYVRSLLNATGAPAAQRRQFEEQVRTLPRAKVEAALLDLINTAATASGEQPVRFRTVKFDITQFDGTPDIKVPADAVPGDLAAFFPKAAATGPAVGGDSGTIDSTSTTSTTAPAA